MLFILEIKSQGGKAFLWWSTNLQFPYSGKEIQFRVVPGATPSIEWAGGLIGGLNDVSGIGTFKFAYNRDQELLKGWLNKITIFIKIGTDFV